MRLRVTEVLELPAAGLSREGVLEERPDLAGEEPTRKLLLTSYARPLLDRNQREPKARGARFAHWADLENPGLIYTLRGAKVPSTPT